MTNEETAPKNRATLVVLAVVIALGLMVGYFIVVKSMMTAKEDKDRLPLLRRIDRPVDLVNQGGNSVDMINLRGKVVVIGYVFTRCPRGCPGVLAEMMGVQKEFAAEKDKFQLVSVSVDSEHDTPAMLKDYAEKLKIDPASNWWLLTGGKNDVARLMSTLIGFTPTREIPEAERMSPDDRFLHDMRLALVDPDGHVRGYYEVMNPDPEYAARSREALRRDIRKLLVEESKPL